MLDDLRVLLQPDRRTWLIGAFAVALLVRAPGVFWGWNYPDGFMSHHPDERTHVVNAELIIAPADGQARDANPYPKGAAGVIAYPIVLQQVLTGQFGTGMPGGRTVVTLGRLSSVAFGAATAIVLALLSLRLTRDWRVAVGSAWLLALGGLLVTQSHFFLADAPGIFWLLLSVYLLALDLERPPDDLGPLRWAAFATGAAFGTKLLVAGIPMLGLVAIRRAPRVARLVHMVVFGVAGLALVNFLAFTPFDIYRALVGGVNDAYEYDRWFGALLYLIELPTILSLPVALAVLGGTALVGPKLVRAVRADPWLWAVVMVPLIVNGLLILFRVDHFPRHVLLLVPWMLLLASWTFVRLQDGLAASGIRGAWVWGPLMAWMALFVLDGEKGFIDDPRNRAAAWVYEHTPEGSEYWWDRHSLVGRENVRFPERGEPPVLVVEMMNANHYVSGIGWRDSYPDDVGQVFDAISPDGFLALQALHRGELSYREVARFDEGYFMPEFRVIDRLIGDRSRNYLTEVIVYVDEERVEALNGVVLP